MQYLQCQVIGHYILPGCSTPDKLGTRADATAREMALAVHWFPTPDAAQFAVSLGSRNENRSPLYARRM